MGKVIQRIPAWVLFALFASSCEMLIGADFEQEFEVDGQGNGCAETCPEGARCNRSLGICQCVPRLCGAPEEPAHECGGFVEGQCGQPVDCGACPSGQECTNAGNGAPNRCTPINGTPCLPKSCAELGQTSGVHFSCGILVDCNAQPECNGECGNDEVCTANGCCTPSPETGDKQCGQFPDGCGRIVDVNCKGNAVCVDGACCSPTADQQNCVDATCGLNTTDCAGVFTECLGTCAEGECKAGTRPFCEAICPGRTCPETPVCGLNDDGCGGEVQCNGRCPSLGDVCTRTFECCTPHCPTTPTACGANDNGCGGKIQCPGPCPSGQTCQTTADATFVCAP